MKLLTSILLLTFVANSFADECKCRIKTINRIINGEISKDHSMPWFVTLVYGYPGTFYCGGSILNEKYILTSASCIESKKPKDISIVVGFKSINDQINKNQRYQVKKIHSKEFKDPKEPGDIAILELEKKIKFVDGEIEKGCFNLEKKEYFEPLLAIGFGHSKQPYKTSTSKKMEFQGQIDVLKQAFLREVSCKEHAICLVSNDNVQSTCVGDSGGPLHYIQNGVTTIEGVGSYTNIIKKEDITYYCAGISVFSRLSYYADWISEIADFDFCGSGPKTEPKYKKKVLGIF